jgi:hypothetical protein
MIGTELIIATSAADLAAVFETVSDMIVMVNRATAIANGTMPMPANPIRGQLFTVVSKVEITSMTLNPQGKTINGNISYLPANTAMSWIYGDPAQADAWFPHYSKYTGYSLPVQALTSSPVDNQTIFFGNLPKAPVTTGGNSKIFIRKPGLIKAAEIYCFSGTAGTNEAWPMSIRLNNTTDTLINSVASATQERIFNNGSLNIPVTAGDYFEIKLVNPAWATNPLTTIFGGYIYME